MIPEIKAIQDRLAFGLITEREAEELYFLIKLVDRDYRLSAAVNREMGEPEAEMEPLDGIASDFLSVKRILPLV